VLSTVRLGMEVLRRPDYEITTQHLLATAMALAEQLLKDGYALADL
ncbi:IS4 family transposase, partial [Vibrio sp. M260112]